MTMVYHKCDSCHAAMLPHEEQMLESYTLCPECYEMVMASKIANDEPRLIAVVCAVLIIVAAVLVWLS